MILSGQKICELSILSPTESRTTSGGVTFGLGPAGYDVRVEFDDEGRVPFVTLVRGDFLLCSTIERFSMPPHVLGVVHDKSSWARRGLAVQNTVIEPGWTGHLTLELSYHGHQSITIPRGVGIAQIIFHLVFGEVDSYDGKYQDQQRGPQGAR